jgi:RNA polymerase sigma factor (sigma-70 family)
MRKLNPLQLKSLSDTDLVNQIILNNEEVIEFLFFEKCSPMFNYILTEIFSHKLDKQELISELYLHLSKNDWKIIRSFEGRSKLTTWLSVVAVRFFIKKRSEMIDSDDKNTLYTVSPDSISSYQTQATISGKMDILKAIQKLKCPRDRFVVIAMEIEGHEAEVIANQLKVTKANLYNIKKRALDKLAILLNDYKYA